MNKTRKEKNTTSTCEPLERFDGGRFSATNSTFLTALGHGHRVILRTRKCAKTGEAPDQLECWLWRRPTPEAKQTNPVNLKPWSHWTPLCLTFPRESCPLFRAL
jgi:hypothetical protein